MATNPVVKLRRGVFSNLTSYPAIDGQLFLATSTDTYLTAAMAKSDTTGYNIFVVDVDVNGQVQRQTIDAYRAIYASEASEALTAGAWTSPALFQISDGTHSGTTLSVDGSSSNTYVLRLPSTISAALVGNVTGTADKAKALVNNSDVAYNVGSDTQPVYFENGIPKVVQGTLSISISGNASTADSWSAPVNFSVADATQQHTGTAVSVDGSSSSGYILKLPATIKATLEGNASSADKINTNAGSANKPVYFSNGIPVEVGDSLQVNITGTAASASVADSLSSFAGNATTPVYINAFGIPTVVTNLDATKLTGMIPLACIPKGAQERMIIKPDLEAIRAMTTTDAQEGDVVKNMTDGSMYYIVASGTTGAAFANATNTFSFMEFSAGASAHAATSDTAYALANNPTITLSGAVTSSETLFDGSTNITINTTALDVSKVNAGTLSVGHGGTGKATWTQWGLVYADTTSSLNQVSAGTPGYVLQSNGSAAPSWLDPNNMLVGMANSLAAPVNINGTSFDGSTSITTAKWGTQRTIKISSSDGSNESAPVTVDGSGNIVLKLADTIKANLTGKADTAGVADGLAHQLFFTVTSINGTRSVDDLPYGLNTMDQDQYYTLEPDDLFNKYQAQYSGITAAGAWTPITTPTGMATGSYMVQIKVSGGSKFLNEYFTGAMSYSNENGGSSQQDSDEVFLHAAGKGLSGERIYLRTRRVQSGKIVIEFASTTSLTANDVLQFTFRRFI